MKYLKVLCLVAIAILSSSCETFNNSQAFLPEMGTTLYLSQNFCYTRSDRVYAINYKNGIMIPAGSQVTNITYSSRRIYFTLVDTSQNITMRYRQKYQRIPVNQFVARLFTNKKLPELTSGFTKSEKDFVKTGVLRKGISKKAVLVGYGYPPAHRTPSLKSNVWTYWLTVHRQQQLIFDKNNKLISYTY